MSSAEERVSLTQGPGWGGDVEYPGRGLAQSLRVQVLLQEIEGKSKYLHLPTFKSLSNPTQAVSLLWSASQSSPTSHLLTVSSSPTTPRGTISAGGELSRSQPPQRGHSPPAPALPPPRGDDGLRAHPPPPPPPGRCGGRLGAGMNPLIVDVLSRAVGRRFAFHADGVSECWAHLTHAFLPEEQVPGDAGAAEGAATLPQPAGTQCGRGAEGVGLRQEWEGAYWNGESGRAGERDSRRDRYLHRGELGVGRGCLEFSQYTKFSTMPGSPPPSTVRRVQLFPVDESCGPPPPPTGRHCPPVTDTQALEDRALRMGRRRLRQSGRE